MPSNVDRVSSTGWICRRRWRVTKKADEQVKRCEERSGVKNTDKIVLESDSVVEMNSVDLVGSSLKNVVEGPNRCSGRVRNT